MTVYEVLTSRCPLFRVPAYSQSAYDRARDGRFHLHEDRPPQGPGAAFDFTGHRHVPLAAGIERDSIRRVSERVGDLSSWPIAAPDVCDGTSACESRHAF